MEENNITSYPKFSVSLSVYNKDNPEHFRKAINSIINQTVKPTEIVLVVDGPVPNEINEIIKIYENNFSYFHIIRLTENKGHAIARQTGMDATNYEFVALMDSDDIAVPDRFEKQLKCFAEETELDVLGGQISEFIETTNNIVGIRNVPLSDSEIKKYIKARCPFNQQTIMLKKSSMLSAGGYIDWHYEEDYYLWIRMFEKGYRFQNLADILVYVRVGNDMYKRRGGIKYFKSETKLQNYMWNKGIINFQYYIFNVIIRFIIQIVLPNKIRGWIFQNIFRKKHIVI